MMLGKGLLRERKKNYDYPRHILYAKDLKGARVRQWVFDCTKLYRHKKIG